MTDRILSGVVLVLFVALLVVLHKAKTARAEVEPRDVGLQLFAEDCGDDTQEWPVHDCDGCEECGAPMVFDECDYGVELTEYGSHMVHRLCLAARRDGRQACTDCAKVMVGPA